MRKRNKPITVMFTVDIKRFYFDFISFLQTNNGCLKNKIMYVEFMNINSIDYKRNNYFNHFNQKYGKYLIRKYYIFMFSFAFNLKFGTRFIFMDIYEYL
jgi:hypothetical protein